MDVGAASYRLIWALVIVGLLVYTVVFELAQLVFAAGPQVGVVLSGAERDRRVGWVLPGTDAWLVGIRPGDRVLATLAEAVPGTPGGAIELIRVQQAATEKVLNVTADLHQLAMLDFSFVILSLAFLVIGVVVLLLADGSPAARALFTLCLSGSIALLIAPATFRQSLWAYLVEFFAVSAVAAACPAFFLSLADPERPLAGRAWQIRLAFFLAAAAVAGAYPIFILLAPDLFHIVRTGWIATLAASFVASIGAAIWALRAAPSDRARRQNQIVGLGAAIGFLPFVLLSLLPFIVTGRYLIRPEIAIVPLVALPASLGYSVLRHHLLGIERLLRRGLLRAAVWLAVVSVGGLLLSLTRPLSGTWEPSPVALGVLIFFAGTLIPWLVRQVHAAIDRRLFHDVYDYGQALLTLTNHLARTRNRDDLRNGVLHALADLLNAESVAVRAFDPHKGGDGPPVWSATALAEYSSGRTPGGIASPGRPEGFPLRLEWAGAPVGYLFLGPKRNGEPYLREDLQLVETLAGGLGTTVENLQLVDELRDRVLEIEQLYRRLTEAQEEERCRIASDIHDDPIQQLYLLIRRLDGPADRPGSGELAAELRRVESTLRGICAALLPPVLKDLGLAAAIEWLLYEQAKKFSGDVTFDAAADVDDLAEALPDDRALVLYRVTQEALNNAFKHAEGGRVEVRLRGEGRTFRIEVCDNGPGFDPVAIAGRRTADGSGLGIAGMRERLRTIGGHLQFLSRPETGTAVVIESDVPERCADSERDGWAGG